MINILNEKHKYMKSEASAEKDAAIIVLNEMRTLEMLEKNPINSQLQYKWFEKLLANRDTSANIYKQQNRMDLYNKEIAEINIIKYYMKELENDMPKQMSEEEVKNIILEMKRQNPFIKIGDVMRCFALNYPNQNKSMVSKLFQSLK